IDQPLRHEARVVVDVLQHRVPAHVLDSPCEDHVGRPHRDLAGSSCDRRQGAGAHAVDSEPRHRPGKPGQQGHVTAERQTLIAHLGGRREHDVIDPLGWERLVAPQQLTDELDGHVISPRAAEDALRPGPPEGAPDAVDVVDLAKLAHQDKASGWPRPYRSSDSHAFGAFPSPTRAPNADTLDAGRRLAVPNQEAGTGDHWHEHVEREDARYRDGESRLPDAADADSRQRQLTRLGNASAGAGLALLMAGRRDEAAARLARAADRYRESFEEAPPGSWGRPIGAIKARLMAGDWEGAHADARWALDAGAAEAASPIGRY